MLFNKTIREIITPITYAFVMRTGNHVFTAEITWLIDQLSKLLRALCDNIH